MGLPSHVAHRGLGSVSFPEDVRDCHGRPNRPEAMVVVAYQYVVWGSTDVNVLGWGALPSRDQRRRKKTGEFRYREHPGSLVEAESDNLTFFPNGRSNVVGVAGSGPPQRSSSPCESTPLAGHLQT